jgi:hypothetical protein
MTFFLKHTIQFQNFVYLQKNFLKMNRMNLETRKIEFVKEFLNLQSEEVISRLENFLKKEKKSINVNIFAPMTPEDLNKRIEKSEVDFLSNRFKNSEELISKYE